MAGRSGRRSRCGPRLPNASRSSGPGYRDRPTARPRVPPRPRPHDPRRRRLVALGRPPGGRQRAAPNATASGRSAELDYAFVLDGAHPALPDPRSAWQPHGVHGPSRTFDASRFAWTDDAWRGPRSGAGVLGSVVYELHVGTFTTEGTLDAAVARLDHLVGLGVDVVELMPVAAFPGRWGWGYDGVGLYSVHDGYGGPAALQRFVDACHARGLGVALDVVHNHLGASGNYLERFGPYFTRGPPHPVGGGGQPRRRGGRRGATVPRRQRPEVVPRLPRRRPAARRGPRAQGRLAAPLPRRALRRRRPPRRGAGPAPRPRGRERPQRHGDGDPDRAGRPRHDRAVGRRRAPRPPRRPDRRDARLLRRLRRGRGARRGGSPRRRRQGADPRLPPRRHDVDLPVPGRGAPPSTSTGSTRGGCSATSRRTTRSATGCRATASPRSPRRGSRPRGPRSTSSPRPRPWCSWARSGRRRRRGSSSRASRRTGSSTPCVAAGGRSSAGTAGPATRSPTRRTPPPATARCSTGRSRAASPTHACCAGTPRAPPCAATSCPTARRASPTSP